MEEVDDINKEILKYKEEQKELDQELNANKNNIVLYYSNMLKTLLKKTILVLFVVVFITKKNILQC